MSRKLSCGRQVLYYVLLDVDNLKEINDNFGHEKGDEALKLCYQCIRRAFKNEKNCFRIGGDEFAYVYHSEERLLLKYRYLKNESWEDISYDLNVSYRTVHRIHASALNNFVVPE